MMKKLLVLLSVLALASMASAAAEISVNGQPAPPTIELAPSDEIIIDVTTDDAGNGLWYLDVYQDDELFDRFDLGALTEGPALGDSTLRGLSLYDGGGYMEVEIVAAWAPPGDQAVPGTLMEILFHCAGEGDVIVELYDADVGYSSPVDSLLIVQTPEPMTIALLGLGGLFLRRRK